MDFEHIRIFQNFITSELEPATIELGNIPDDNSRLHLQKLVYTNLVDRFDWTIDKTILANHKDEFLVSEAMKTFNAPVVESDLIKMFLSDNIQEELENRIQDALRNTVLRQRHSKKLKTLFESLSLTDNVWSLPRVNRSSGSIAIRVKKQKKPTPVSICGFADWLYSRRNAIVHGGGSSQILSNDLNQIKQLFKATVPKKFIIKLTSIKVAARFYSDVFNIIIEKTSG